MGHYGHVVLWFAMTYGTLWTCGVVVYYDIWDTTAMWCSGLLWACCDDDIWDTTDTDDIWDTMDKGCSGLL